MAGFGRNFEIARVRARIKRRLKAVREELRGELEDGIGTDAALLASTIRRAAPVEDGALRDSIDVELLKPPRVGALVFAGGPSANYARYVEFGHDAAAPAPFFWPTYRSLKKPIKRRIAQRIRRAIRKGVKSA